jgi:hypothetical protein
MDGVCPQNTPISLSGKKIARSSTDKVEHCIWVKHLFCMHNWSFTLLEIQKEHENDVHM